MVATSSYFDQSPFGGNTSSWNTWGQNPGYFGSTNTQNNWGQNSGYTSGFKFDSPDYSGTFKKQTPDPGNWLKAYTENMNLLGSDKEDKNKYRSSFDPFNKNNQAAGTENNQQQQWGFGGQQSGGGGGSSGGVTQVTGDTSLYQPPMMNPFTVAGMPGQQGRPGVLQTILPLAAAIPGIGTVAALGLTAAGKAAGAFNV